MKIQISAFVEDDFDRLISWVKSEEMLFQFAGTDIFTFPLTQMQLEQYVLDPNRIIFKVVDSETNLILGHAELYVMPDFVVKFCRILIAEEQYRGQGIGQEVISQLLVYSKDVLCKKQAMLNVYDWNIDAIKCYEKCGFVINPDVMSNARFKGADWLVRNMIYNFD